MRKTAIFFTRKRKIMTFRSLYIKTSCKERSITKNLLRKLKNLGRACRNQVSKEVTFNIFGGINKVLSLWKGFFALPFREFSCRQKEQKNDMQFSVSYPKLRFFMTYYCPLRFISQNWFLWLKTHFPLNKPKAFQPAMCNICLFS